MKSAAVDSKPRPFPVSLGFRDGPASVHTSRTMMLAELTLVLEHLGQNAASAEYVAAVVDDNILGKPTQTTRKRSVQRLAELYSLDQAVPVFRVLRQLWNQDATSRPFLAFLAACARDPLLRDATPFVIKLPVGTVLKASQVADYLTEMYPARFKPTTLASTAQNLASSWTQAGLLTGRLNKMRVRPVVTPVIVAYALLLGYLCGLRGRLVLDSIWTRLLDRAVPQIADLATEASRQGWMNYKAVGSVVEVTFPGLLTSKEEKKSSESD